MQATWAPCKDRQTGSILGNDYDVQGCSLMGDIAELGDGDDRASGASEYSRDSLNKADTQNTRQVTVMRSIPTEMLLPIYTIGADEAQPSTVRLWTVRGLSNDSKPAAANCATEQQFRRLCSSSAESAQSRLRPRILGSSAATVLRTVGIPRCLHDA